MLDPTTIWYDNQDLFSPQILFKWGLIDLTETLKHISVPWTCRQSAAPETLPSARRRIPLPVKNKRVSFKDSGGENLSWGERWLAQQHLRSWSCLKVLQQSGCLLSQEFEVFWCWSTVFASHYGTMLSFGPCMSFYKNVEKTSCYILRLSNMHFWKCIRPWNIHL